MSLSFILRHIWNGKPTPEIGRPFTELVYGLCVMGLRWCLWQTDQYFLGTASPSGGFLQHVRQLLSPRQLKWEHFWFFNHFLQLHWLSVRPAQTHYTSQLYTSQLYTVCGNKKHPSTKSSIFSKLRNVFVWKFQGLLRRKFATNVSSFVQYYESLRKWHVFLFLMR